LSYSIPFKGKLSFDELNKKLYYLKDLPNSIPYRTCYYGNDWGFCLSYNEYLKLNKNDIYEVVIDSEFYDGSLSYGELIISGTSNKEILISTYICHPSMCNDNLSGIVVSTYLAKYLLEKSNYYTYRFVFVPETIGAISFIYNNFDNLKKNIIGGYVITHVGDEGQFTYLQTRKTNQFIDKITLFLFKSLNINYKLRFFKDCGSDERQYNFPNIDLNIGSLMKTKYLESNEYHTSDDNFNYVTEKGLNESLEMYKKCISLIDNNHIYEAISYCEPKLDKYGLWDNIGGTKNIKNKSLYIKVLYYCDGTNDIIDISNILSIDYLELLDIINILLKYNLIKNILTTDKYIEKKDLQRLTFSSNCYDNLYNFNELKNGLINNIDNKSYNFTNCIKLYNKYKNINASGVWKWINNKQNDLFDMFKSNNINKLHLYYSNLFRNSILSNGLVSHNLLKDETITDDNNKINNYINLLLQDIDTCKDLLKINNIELFEFPKIGNPYGILLNNTLITSDQPRHLYDAYRIYEITKNIDNPIILEIGGGFGGVLFNLLNIFNINKKKFTYINVDIFSTATIFMYFIDNYLKNNNIKNEIIISLENKIETTDIKTNIILKIFDNMPFIVDKNIDIVYNSHSLSEMSKEHIDYYINILDTNKVKYFYHINTDYFPWKTSFKNHIEINASDFNLKNYKKLSHSISPWLCGGNERYREFLYERIYN
jgi:putative sugar O-methyltransferase